MSLIPRPSSPHEKQEPIVQSTGIVLDALPYVEPLDPHYEQQAISLIEAELTSAMEEGEHPSLQRRLLPPSRFVDDDTDTNNSSERMNAPLATMAYQSLKRRQGEPMEHVEWVHPVPFSGTLTDDPQKTVAELEASIQSSKVRLEHHRLQLVNLELHSAFTSSDSYQRYHSLLEDRYVDPQRKLLSEQRLRVDGVNARRMEEQGESMKRLVQLRQRWEWLMEKNGRLDGAIEVLEREVAALEKEHGGGNEGMVGGVESREH